MLNGKVLDFYLLVLVQGVEVNQYDVEEGVQGFVLEIDIQLSKAIKIASELHYRQVDKSGVPYILHPLHVMNTVLSRSNDFELAAIAVLHDVIEDCFDSIESGLIYLSSEGMSQKVLDTLVLLTHTKGESYLDSYIPRVMTCPDAIMVKKVDIEHNSDIMRLKRISEERDVKRMIKYHKAYQMLLEAESSSESSKEIVEGLSEGLGLV